MPLNVESFRSLVNQTHYGNRDIIVSGEGKNATARLGNFFFSQGKAANNATMKAFRNVLQNEYGSLGAHAFDTILGVRSQLNKSLRACDIQRTLSSLPSIRQTRYNGEVERQLVNSPKMMELDPEDAAAVRNIVRSVPIEKIGLEKCQTPEDLSALAARQINNAIEERRNKKGEIMAANTLGARKAVETEAGAREATGLRNLKTILAAGATSVEDQVKSGSLGVGMSVNKSDTNAILLEEIKTKGVEPGFTYRNDWSPDDTRGLMSDINSDESRAALDELKAKAPAFAKKCDGKTLREQIMLAGRAHPGGIAAVAEFVLAEAAVLAKRGRLAPPRRGNRPAAQGE